MDNKYKAYCKLRSILDEVIEDDEKRSQIDDALYDLIKDIKREYDEEW